jgi:hypothetical protein
VFFVTVRDLFSISEFFNLYFGISFGIGFLAHIVNPARAEGC